MTIEERNILVTENIDLVSKHAIRIINKVPSQLDEDDLISHLQLSLIIAVDRYNDKKDKTLRRYLNSRLKSSSMDYLRIVDYLPVMSRLKQKKADKAYMKLSNALFREPTVEEMAKELNISVNAYLKLEVLTQNVLLTSIINDDNSDSPFDILDDTFISVDAPLTTHQTPEQILVANEIYNSAVEAFNKVNRKTQIIYILYFLYNLNMCDIGSLLNVQPSYICACIKQVNTTINNNIGGTYG